MKEIGKARFNVGIGWFVLMFCMGLMDLPFRYFLKDDLSLSASELAWFFAIVNIPIYIKPVLGFFTDVVKLRGSRRRYYMLISLLICSIVYFVLGFVSTIEEALLSYFILTLFLTQVSIILGAMIVEYGNKYQNTGGFSSLRIASIKIAVLIGGPIGGYLAMKDINISTSICATMMMILLPIYYLTFKEKKNETNEYNFYAEFKNQLKNLLHSRVLLLTILLIFLWKISPGFTTPLLYYQTDQLQFNSSFIGLLYSLLAAGGIIGAIMYNHLCKHINLRLLLIIGITIDAIDSLIYLAYNGQVSAVLITALNGITAALCALPLYDLAARATPKKSESIGYALILSVWNVADALSDVLASKLYDAYNIQFHSLVWINTLSTLAILLFVPLIPKWITNYTDKSS